MRALPPYEPEQSQKQSDTATYSMTAWHGQYSDSMLQPNKPSEAIVCFVCCCSPPPAAFAPLDALSALPAAYPCWYNTGLTPNPYHTRSACLTCLADQTCTTVAACLRAGLSPATSIIMCGDPTHLCVSKPAAARSGLASMVCLCTISRLHAACRCARLRTRREMTSGSMETM